MQGLYVPRQMPGITRLEAIGITIKREGSTRMDQSQQQTQIRSGGTACRNLEFLKNLLEASLTEIANASVVNGSRQISRSQIDRIIKGQKPRPAERLSISRALLRLINERWSTALLFRED